MIYLLLSNYLTLKGEDNWPSVTYYDDMFQSGDMIIYGTWTFIILEKHTEHFVCFSNHNQIVSRRRQGIFGPLYAEL